jgi:hypothetical protein
MVVAYQLHIGGYHRIVIYGYASGRHHKASGHDDDVAADCDAVESDAR